MRHTLLALTLIAGTSLMAQEVRINGGVQVGLAAPTGDFATKETPWGEPLGANGGFGFHVGGHLDTNFNAHNQLRFHITVHGFAGSQQDIYDDSGYYNGTRQNSFGIVQLGADYVFNFTSPSKGAYLLAGVSLNNVSGTATFSDYENQKISQSGCGGFRVGVGYNFNRVFSLEAQLNSISVDATGANGLGYDAVSWVSLSAVLRFGRP